MRRGKRNQQRNETNAHNCRLALDAEAKIPQRPTGGLDNAGRGGVRRKNAHEHIEPSLAPSLSLPPIARRQDLDKAARCFNDARV
jgi:hypothetical protein